ncbi:dermonecrotic toxin domain-containing protein [Pseudomonas sp. PSKL.D1]|uniref:dermonecrotic toxin domain-containing protein n=1 Tax=Pseudomonas sp. PSKL.D1 TaxID=3029060 RepID=UPI00238147A3|nr:DUF6543 domain-containing protein [Pseudomonas sp. PSKL.D1]WDY59509.1 glycosyltransferase [Pseudomonas sp. PSKL.D1]
MASLTVNNAGVQFIRSHLQNIPRPDNEASNAIGQWARQQGHPLDPTLTDVVTLHYRGNQAVIAQCLPLPQAVLSNWQGESSKDLIGQLFPGGWAGSLPDGPLHIVEHLPELGALDNSAPYAVFNGLFRRTDPPRYDSTTRLPVDVEAMQDFIWTLDFHARFVAMLDAYWQHATQSHRQSLKISFIAACNKQVQEGSLSDIGRQLAWQAAGLMPQAADFRIRPLNVYGYAATDLLCMADKAQRRVLLYLPGNASPFHEFGSMSAMKDWFALQCRDADKRQRLRQYFRQADTPDGLDFSGLDTALAGLAAYPGIHYRSPNRPGFTTDGRWAPNDYVNYKASKYSPQLRGDLFAALTERQRERSYADADFIITSNQDVTKARWRGYLVTTLNLLAPFALVVPALAPLLALGGIAQFGLGIDRAINGKTLEDKAGGVDDIAFGLLNAAPLAMQALDEARVLFPPRSKRFVAPVRLNDQLGYPLSPVDPPRLPLDTTASLFGDTVPPLPSGDPEIAARVARIPVSADGPEQLQSVIGGYNASVLYDAEHDAFIRDYDVNEVMPTYYQATGQSRGLNPIDVAARPVTHEMRMSSLRAMGVDIQLPVDLSSFEGLVRQPIPKQIFSLWVGDRVIPSELLATLAGNSERLASSQYTFRLYLSKNNPAAFDENLRLLHEQAPRLRVLPLEDQPVYQQFSESRLFEQYQQATAGAGANFASASDILRYPLLEAEGGIYLDIDDTLLADPNAPHDLKRAAIDTLELSTTPDGLLLGVPVNQEDMNMHCQFNSNMIGSHAGNPTLRQIADTLHERFQADAAFYQSRPLSESDGFSEYSRQLSHLTGPRMLNDVIDQHLPRLRTLRQLINLQSLPQNNPMFLIDGLGQIANQVIASELALTKVADVGNFHSWAKP